jgi:hypothetical protein
VERLAGQQGANRQALTTVRNRLGDCRETLWAASDDEALKSLAEQLATAEEELVPLRATAGEPTVPAALAEAVTQVFEAQPAATPMALIMAPQQPAAGGATPGAVVPVAPQLAPPLVPPVPPVIVPRRLTEEEAGRAVRRALYIQVFVVLAAAALAIATGLEILYVGKTWGTGWDWLAAIVWGTAAQAVATTLVTSLDNLGALAALRRT